MTATAHSAFDHDVRRFHRLVAELAHQVKKLEKRADAHPFDWSAAGSMNKVNADLADLVRFLGGEE